VQNRASLSIAKAALAARRTACGSFFALRAKNDPPIEQRTMLPFVLSVVEGQAKKPERKQAIHYEFVKM